MAELSGVGPTLHSGATSVVDDTQVGKFGRRGFDLDGNEYIYVDFQQALQAGEFVVINKDYAASRLAASSRGPIGVVIGTVSASDRFGWVQIRGVHTSAWATSGATTVEIPIISLTSDLGAVGTATSADTGVAIRGLHIATDPDTCASTALGTSAVAAPCTVILSYPFIDGSLAVSS